MKEVAVVPCGRNSWEVRYPDQASSRTYTDKSVAIARAKEAAISLGVGLVIFGSRGEIQARRSFTLEDEVVA